MYKLEEVFGFKTTSDDLLARAMFEVSLLGHGNIVLVEGEADKKVMRLILRRLRVTDIKIVNCNGKDTVIGLLKTYTGEANLIGLVDKDLGTKVEASLVITKFMNLEHELLQTNDINEISTKLNLSLEFLENINILMAHVYKKIAGKSKINASKPSNEFLTRTEIEDLNLINLNGGLSIDWGITIGDEYLAAKQAMGYAHKKGKTLVDQSYEAFLCDWVGASSDSDAIVELGRRVIKEFK